MPFHPGESGNPAGRPRGARNYATRLIEMMREAEAEDIVCKAIELAKAGNTAAIRLCFDRLCPPRNDRPAPIELPKMRTVGDAVAAMAAIVQAMAAGELTPREAENLAKAVLGFAKALQIHDHEARLKRLERRRADETNAWANGARCSDPPGMGDKAPLYPHCFFNDRHAMFGQADGVFGAPGRWLLFSPTTKRNWEDARCFDRPLSAVLSCSHPP